MQPDLAKLGNRICIIGPSSSGKSTLASALAKKLGYRAVHLDLLYHKPHTQWVPRPKTDFEKLHRQAIRGNSWVMEGNYSAFASERFAHATGIIILRSGRFASLRRFVLREYWEQGNVGRLKGAKPRVPLSMIMHVLVHSPPRLKLLWNVALESGLTIIEVGSMSLLLKLHSEWELEL